MMMTNNKNWGWTLVHMCCHCTALLYPTYAQWLQIHQIGVILRQSNSESPSATLQALTSARATSPMIRKLMMLLPTHKSTKFVPSQYTHPCFASAGLQPVIATLLALKRTKLDFCPCPLAEVLFILTGLNRIHSLLLEVAQFFWLNRFLFCFCDLMPLFHSCLISLYFSTFLCAILFRQRGCHAVVQSLPVIRSYQPTALSCTLMDVAICPTLSPFLGYGYLSHIDITQYCNDTPRTMTVSNCCFKPAAVKKNTYS